MGLKLDNRQEIEATLVDDYTTANVTYLGYVAPNASSAALLEVAIEKIDETTGVVITWAGGNQKFDKAWAARATLIYSQLTE